jgi:hypothetical protein
MFSQVLPKSLPRSVLAPWRAVLTAGFPGIAVPARPCEEASDAASRQVFLDAVAHGSVISWQHINLLGEYDFFQELQNTLAAQAAKASQDLKNALTAQAVKASGDLQNTLFIENQKFTYEIVRDLVNLGDDGERLTKARLYQGLGQRLLKGDFLGWLNDEIVEWEHGRGPVQTYDVTQRRVVIETRTGTVSHTDPQVRDVVSALLARGFIRNYNPEAYKNIFGQGGGQVIIYYNPQDAELGKIVQTIVKERGKFTDVAAPEAKPDLAPGIIYLYLPK